MMRNSFDSLDAPQYAAHREFWQRHLDGDRGFFRFASHVLCEPAEGALPPPHVVVPLDETPQGVLDRLSGRSDDGVLVVVAAALALLAGRLCGTDEVAFELPAHRELPLQERPVLAIELNPLSTSKDVLVQLARSVPAVDAHAAFALREFAQQMGNETGADVFLSSQGRHGDGTAGEYHSLSVHIASGERTVLHLGSPNRALPPPVLSDLGAMLGALVASFATPERLQCTVQEVIEPCFEERLTAFNRTAVAFDEAWSEHAGQRQRSTVIDLFERRVAERPDDIALICGSQQLSYAQLDEWATRLAAVLSGRLGVGEDAVVGVLCRRSHWAIVALLAVFKAGATFLPLNAKQPPVNLARVLAESRASAVLTQSDHLDTLMDAVDLPLYALDLQLANETSSVDPVARRADGVAYIVYTSGTTGSPKGVMIDHDGLANTVLEHIQRFHVTPSDRYLQFMAMSFDGFLLDAFMTLCAGATLIIADEDCIDDPSAFMACLERHQATLSTITPSYLECLDPERIGQLRVLVSAGEAMPLALVRRYAHRLALYNGYGPSEATINATLHRVEPNVYAGPAARQTIPIGGPSANKHIHVVNDRLERQPIGVVGEICISGAGLARGYVEDPVLTAEKFVACPFEPGRTMYRTGDFGAWNAEGELLFRGRSDNQVKVNGLRIDLSEIEIALRNSPGVDTARVLALPSASGRTELCAFLQRRPRMELVPSLGEYGVYDVFLYESMANDGMRVEGYRHALAGRVEGKVVLDPGTGSQLILARRCIDAGAARVYAIEMDEEAFQEARRTVERLELADRIVLIKGDIASIDTLPEPIDVVVSALAGNVASADGCIPLVQQIRRLVPPRATFVPNRYITRIAGFDLAESHTEDGFSDISVHYARALYEKYGRPFDFRLCVQNMNHDLVLTDVRDAECIAYQGDLTADAATSVKLTVKKAGCLRGFVLWLNAFCDDELMIDSSKATHHLPVYLPLCADSTLDARIGDRIELTFTRRTGKDGLHPDYAIDGVLSRPGEVDRSFRCDSSHAPDSFRENPLHAALLGEDGTPQPMSRRSEADLRASMRSQLPPYMVPHRFVEVTNWPLTAHGKLDARELASLVRIADDRVEGTEPESILEATLCRLWADVLDRRRLGTEDNLFHLGCDSIRVIQAVHRARQEGIHMEAADVMTHPTVRAQAALIDGRQTSAEPVPLALAALTADETAALPGGVDDAFPASAMQVRMVEAYAADRLRQGIYHCCAIWHIDDASLNEPALLEALQTLQDTQPSLRTSFIAGEDGRWLQVVRKPGRLPISRKDLRASGISTDDDFFRREIDADVSLPFAMPSDEPPLRFKLWRTSATSLSLMFSFHHAILDGWSGVELRNALMSHYLAIKAGIPTVARPVTVDARKEFVALEAERLGDSPARRHWEEALRHVEVRHDLLRSNVLDDRKDGKDRGLLRTASALLPSTAVAAADETSRRAGVTLKAVYLCAVAKALMEIAATPTVTLGVVMNGRTDRLGDPLKSTGLFWNIVPLRLAADASSTPSSTQALLNGIEAVSGFPLGEIERLLDGPVDLPSFNFVNFHNLRQEPGVSLREGVVNDRFDFPLNVFVAVSGTDDGREALMRIECDTTRFDGERVAALIERTCQHLSTYH